MPGDRYSRELEALERKHRLRVLAPITGKDFASNDYLGLSHHPAIKQAIVDALDSGVAVGAGASRLLRGNHRAHEALEDFARIFFNAPAALYMSTGYAANFALFTTLTKRGDIIFHDALCHASTREGIFAAKAQAQEIKHNDANAFEDAVKKWRRSNTGQIWIAVETLYSMDGDIAPLGDLMDIAVRHGAMIVADEAHATGVHGARGRGFTEPFANHENLICVHTCGKALGCQGALITTSGKIRDYLINTARPFVFSTAPSPLMAVAVQTALGLIDAEPERRTRLAAMYARAYEQLAAITALPDEPTQILPIIVGTDENALALAAELQAQGFDVRPVRPPSVAEGTARLRLAVTLNVEPRDVDALTMALTRAFAAQPAQ